MFAMYAVIKTGGKQYRVVKDDVIVVERLAGAAGDEIELDQVLMLDDGKGPTLGTPLVDGARVAATVLDQSRGKKILVFKKKRRKNYRRTMGHRQDLTVLRITDILAKGKKAPASRAKAKAKAKDDEPAAEAAEATAAEASATEAPVTEAPVTEAPVTEAPATEAPATEAPTVEEAPKASAPESESGENDGAGGAGEAEEKS